MITPDAVHIGCDSDGGKLTVSMAYTRRVLLTFMEKRKKLNVNLANNNSHLPL